MLIVFGFHSQWALSGSLPPSLTRLLPDMLPDMGCEICSFTHGKDFPKGPAQDSLKGFKVPKVLRGQGTYFLLSSCTYEPAVMRIALLKERISGR